MSKSFKIPKLPTLPKSLKPYVPLLAILVVAVIASMVSKWRNVEHFAAVNFQSWITPAAKAPTPAPTPAPAKKCTQYDSYLMNAGTVSGKPMKTFTGSQADKGPCQDRCSENQCKYYIQKGTGSQSSCTLYGEDSTFTKDASYKPNATMVFTRSRVTSCSN